jgi:hypothetical protein
MESQKEPLPPGFITVPWRVEYREMKAEDIEKAYPSHSAMLQKYAERTVNPDFYGTVIISPENNNVETNTDSPIE